MMLRFLRRTFGRRSMQRHAGRAANRARDERDGGAMVMATGASPAGAHYPHSTLLPAPVVSGGASVHIPAAGDSKSVLTCRVLLLDGAEVSVELPVSHPNATILLASVTRAYYLSGAY